ncbi:hypothetical protein D920_02549 [Enterococcus faecalis 13-SD-W-01]|nr:hypothetical protein D920_02549 [Enterococcus faecalis 13-SD-W-01]
MISKCIFAIGLHNNFTAYKMIILQKQLNFSIKKKLGLYVASFF